MLSHSLHLFLQNFIMPFTSAYYTRFLNYLRNKLVGGIEVFKRSATKLHIFIDIQGPTFLLPQKKDAPSLLVFDTGICEDCIRKGCNYKLKEEYSS